MPATTLLIAHSRRLLADSLGRALRELADLKLLTEHPVSGKQTVDLVELYLPDVLLVDYWLHGMQGPAVVQAVRKLAPGCKVIVLSWFHGAPEIENCFSAGAVGFLPESLTVDQVGDAVRRAQEGESPVYPEELKEMAAKIAGRTRQSDKIWERLRTLTRRELEILGLLSLGHSLQAIAEDLFISPKTARNHVDNMLAKTQTHTQAEMLSLARDHGLIAG
ncbi:MAG: LuxR C-terminal-related transcriptional regulator [Actinomycetota bacterium]